MFVCFAGVFFLTILFYKRAFLDSIISSLSVMNLKIMYLCNGRVVHLLLSEFRILKGVLRTAGSVPWPQNLKKKKYMCMYRDVADIYSMNTYEKDSKLDLFNFIVTNLFLFSFFNEMACALLGENE